MKNAAARFTSVTSAFSIRTARISSKSGTGRETCASSSSSARNGASNSCFSRNLRMTANSSLLFTGRNPSSLKNAHVLSFTQLNRLARLEL